MVTDAFLHSLNLVGKVFCLQIVQLSLVYNTIFQFLEIWRFMGFNQHLEERKSLDVD